MLIVGDGRIDLKLVTDMQSIKIKFHIQYNIVDLTCINSQIKYKIIFLLF